MARIGKNSKKRTFPSGTVQFLYDRYVGDDPELIASYEEEALNAEIVQKICDLRTQAGLSQRALAKLAGTSASAIARLEDADYTGHSLSLLKRVASALASELKFVSFRKAAPCPARRYNTTS